MDKAAIVKGIAAYAHEQTALLRLLRRRGSFTAEDFDRWLYGREWRRPMRARGIDGDSFLLGGLGGMRDQWLNLLQLMGAIGLVDTERRDGVLHYVLAQRAETN